MHKLGTQIISGHLYYSRLRAQIISQQVYQFDLVFEGLQLPYLSLTLGMSRIVNPQSGGFKLEKSRLFKLKLGDMDSSCTFRMVSSSLLKILDNEHLP